MRGRWNRASDYVMKASSPTELVDRIQSTLPNQTEPESPSPSCLCWFVLMGDLDGIAGTDLVFAEVQRRQCELGSAVVWCSLGCRTEPPTLAGQRLGRSFILCFQRWLE